MKKTKSSSKFVSFRWKVFILIVVMTIVPLSLMTIAFLSKSEQAITKQTAGLIGRSLTTTINRIDFSLQRTLGMSDLILLNEQFIETTQGNTVFSSDEKVKKYQIIRDVSKQYISAVYNVLGLTGIDSCYVYLPSQNTLIDSSTTFYENVITENIDFIQQNLRGDFHSNWIKSTPVDYYSLNNIEEGINKNKNISYLRELNDKAGKLKALILINIKGNFISDYYDKVQTGIPSELIILDENGKLVSHDVYNLLDKETLNYIELNKQIEKSKDTNGLFIEIEGTEKFVVYAKSAYTKWTYVVVVPKLLVLSQLYEVQKYLTLTIAILFPIIIVLTFLISWIFYRPLKELVNAMKQIKAQQLSVRIKNHRGDEYQQVFDGFNHMLDEIELLIKNLTNEKILNKEAEIMLLQAQINPHFLYNTLESIHSIAKINKVDEIALMVSALSKFFRLSLSEGRNEIPLKDSLELVINYLTIQNIRFKGKIDYQIDMPQQVMDIKVPKFLLQPIVENAVFHGIEKKMGIGHLSIKGEIIENDLMIKIVDDGQGIQAERLNTIIESLNLSDFGDVDFYALKNINKQLQLKYGSHYGLKIKSDYNQGTTVIICLPLTQGGGAIGV